MKNDSTTRFRFRGRDDQGRWRMGDLQLHGNMVWVGGNLVEAKTVGLDTGLNDVRTQPIFEGDIIDFIKDGELCETPCVVRWHPYLTLFYICFSHEENPRESDTKSSLGNMMFQHGYQVKILGNIYDNPELLPEHNPYMTIHG